MKLFTLTLGSLAVVIAEEVNPIEGVIRLITGLQNNLVQDGENEEKSYHNYFEWCDDATSQKAEEIKTAGSDKEKLVAEIDEAKSQIDGSNTKIVDLAASIAADEKKLARAKSIRQKEREEFEASESELKETVDMLERAIGVLNKEIKKGASFVQGAKNTKQLETVLIGLTTVVDAAGFLSEDDKDKLASFIQDREDAEDVDDDAGAPDPAAYKSGEGTSSIVELMEDLRDKADAQLGKERDEEKKSAHNFDMLEQSLQSSVGDSNKDLDGEKSGLAASTEAKATAEGGLAVTEKLLAEGVQLLAEMKSDCLTKAHDHEVTVAGRTEELAVLAKTKKIIQASMSFAQSEKTSSFLQVSSQARGRSPLQGSNALKMIQQVAKQQRSGLLNKLASKVKSMLQYADGSSAEGVFDKVKGMITDMVAKLEEEASAEAAEKEYCDEQMKSTEEKKGDLEDSTEGLKASIDEDASASAQLKEQVTELQAELAQLAKLQVGMDSTRAEAKNTFEATSADLKKGLSGIQKAMGVLGDYYAKDDEEGGASLEQTDASFTAFMQQPAAPEKHQPSSGAGNSILSFLQVIEADLAKNLTEEEAEESAAQAAYDRETQENSITKATKEQDVILKTRFFKGLDKRTADATNDFDTASTELASVNEYYAKLRKRCVAKPETYEVRAKRRAAEIAGLKDAQGALASEATAALIQQHRRALRG